LDAADFVDKSLLTSEEGVAFATDISRNTVFGTAGCKTGTTTTSDRDLVVGGMDA